MNAPFPHRQANAWTPNEGWVRGVVRPCPAEFQLRMEAEQFGTRYVPPIAPHEIARITGDREAARHPIFATKPMTGWQCAMFTLLMVVIFGVAVVA